MSQIVEKVHNKLGLSSAKLSRDKFGCLEVIFEVVQANKMLTILKV